MFPVLSGWRHTNMGNTMRYKGKERGGKSHDMKLGRAVLGEIKKFEGKMLNRGVYDHISVYTCIKFSNNNKKKTPALKLRGRNAHRLAQGYRSTAHTFISAFGTEASFELQGSLWVQNLSLSPVLSLYSRPRWQRVGRRKEGDGVLIGKWLAKHWKDACLYLSCIDKTCRNLFPHVACNWLSHIFNRATGIYSWTIYFIKLQLDIILPYVIIWKAFFKN